MVADLEWLPDVNQAQLPGEAALAAGPEVPDPVVLVAGRSHLFLGFNGTPVEFVDDPRLTATA